MMGRKVISKVQGYSVKLDTGKVEKAIRIEIVDGAPTTGIDRYPTVVTLDLFKAGLLAAQIEKEIKDLDEAHWQKLYGPTDSQKRLVKAVKDLIRDAKAMDDLLLKDKPWSNAPKGSIERMKKALKDAFPTLTEDIDG